MAMTPQLRTTPTRSRTAVARTRTALAAGAVLVVSAAAGCGTAAAPSSGSAAHTAAASPASASKVSLDVTITGSGDTTNGHWTLHCDPASGNLPDVATACAAVTKTPDLFFPPQLHVNCPMIVANAERAVISGTYYGRHVDETIIDGGCDLGRWATLRQIFN